MEDCPRAWGWGLGVEEVGSTEELSRLWFSSSVIGCFSMCLIHCNTMVWNFSWVSCSVE